MGTLDPAAMSEAQASKFAAYQEQQRLIREKQEAVRSKLKGELNKLR